MTGPASHFDSDSAAPSHVVRRAEFERLTARIAELEQSEIERAFLGAIVEDSEDSIITIDLQGQITSWNAAAERLYGYPPAEAVGQPLTMLTLPADLAQVFERIEHIKQSERIATFDTVRVHKDGHELCLSVTLSPVKDRAGTIIGVSTIARDITSRKQAETALRESNAVIAELRETLVTVCAWTQRVRHEDGWMNLSEFLSQRLGLRLTHTICKEAAESVLEERKRKQGGSGDPSTQP
jgi:PAS domain S-box-containing protein